MYKNDKVRFVKKSGAETIFKISTFSSIGEPLLRQLFKRHNAQWLVFRPNKPEFSDLEQLRKNVSDKYFIQLGCVAKNVDINIPLVVKCNKNLIIRKPTNLDSLKKMVNKTWKKHFLSDWKTYLGRKLTEEWLNLLTQTVSLDKSIVIEYNDKSVALITLFSHFDCTNAPVEQVGWVWIKSSLPNIVRTSVHKLMIKWLRKRHNSLYQAGIHVYNIRSQKFFKKIGFKFVCVHILKK